MKATCTNLWTMPCTRVCINDIHVTVVGNAAPHAAHAAGCICSLWAGMPLMRSAATPTTRHAGARGQGPWHTDQLSAAIGSQGGSGASPVWYRDRESHFPKVHDVNKTLDTIYLHPSAVLSHCSHTLVCHTAAAAHIQALQPSTVLSHCLHTAVCNTSAAAHIQVLQA